jgi:hypothetical protein
LQEEDEGPQRESRAAILKAKFGAFLASLYAETLGSMRRLNQAQGLVHFNAGKFLFMRSFFVTLDLHVLLCRANHTWAAGKNMDSLFKVLASCIQVRQEELQGLGFGV